MKVFVFLFLLTLATSAFATPIDCGSDNPFTPSAEFCGGKPKALDDYLRATYGDAYADSLRDFIPDGLGQIGDRLWLYGFERGYYAELTGIEWQGAHAVPEPSAFVLMGGGMLALLWVRRRPRS